MMVPAAPLPPVVGHRGAAAHAPENTLASLRRAAALGARWVEFDTKLSRDGHVVVLHDDTLERTTDGAGSLADMDLAAIKALDAGAWFGAAFRGERVPTLTEAIAELAALGLGANVEVKASPGREAETAAAVARVLRQHWPAALPPPVISSFREETLGAVRAAAPELARALLVLEVPGDWRRRLEGLGCGALHCRHGDLDEARARQVVAAGFALRCFTVNDPARAETLYGWGVETVFSDCPERILAR